MEKPQAKVAQKVLKAQTAVSWSSSRVMSNHNQKDRPQEKLKTYQKGGSKENTKPVEIKLHTQQRAAKRAMFNHFVATKLYFMEQQKKQVERIQKMIEEEEIRLMRKEMIPKAQLMPFFDRPFFPQRSERPLTIPREPSLHILSSRSWRCNSCNELSSFHHHHHIMRAI